MTDFEKLAADSEKATKARDAEIEAEVDNPDYTASQRKEMQPHRKLFAECTSKRRELQINGGKLSNYIRSALTKGPSERLAADLESALTKLDARYPAPPHALA